MATARDDGGFWAAMFGTVTVSGVPQILTPDVMLDLLSDKCGSAYEMYENLSWVRVAVICVVLALIFLAFFYLLSGLIERQWRDMRDEFRGTGQET